MTGRPPTVDPDPDPGSGTDASAAAGRPRRRLSVLRMAGALVVVAVAASGTTALVMRAVAEDESHATRWFAPYVDVTLPPFLNFQDPVVNPNRDVVLSFVVAAKDDPCAPSWGAAYDLDAAASELDLDRRIVRHRQRGGDVIVSFGGVANDELAVACTDPEDLADAYRAVVERYHLRAVDLDVESGGLDAEASARRARAVARVQADEREKGRTLEVWLTLPVAPDGLPADALAVVDGMVEAGVALAGVNIMTMEFGSSRPAGTDFVDAALAAVDATAAQVQAAYQRAGITLALAEAYARVGVTPMIGQNDHPADRLDVGGARRLVDQAGRRGVSRFSMWSLNRDVACAGNVDPAIANTSCSGVDQDPLEFSRVFGSGGGRATGTPPPGPDAVASGRAPVVAVSGVGPHDEWRPRREYDTAAKVVWRGQVYEAKWWNVESQPDAPVKHEWESPWRILGPVLASDGPPPPPPTIPDGTYPAWQARLVYEVGDRVQHLGVGYRAKWWNRGDDPTADVDNVWENPWEPLPPPAPSP